MTDIGKRRKLNQDFVYTSEKPVGNLPNLFIVADGMGGHKAGDIASRCAVEMMVNEIEASKDTDPVVIIRSAIESANDWVRTLSRADEELSGMGSTVVAATCKGRNLLVANVGDSRLYVVGTQIKQITIDHSLVEEMVRMGGIDRETARNHPDKNIITRAVGVTDEIAVDFFQVELVRGDMILMCSDGLTNMLEDEEIRMILKGQRDIVEKVEELVRAANDNGGKDNISVILIEPAMDEVEND